MAAAPGGMSASASGSPAKTAHYSSAVNAALLKGSWADGQAGKDAKGYDLSWGELVRKWGKHTGGNTALIHHLRDISLLYLSAHSSLHPSASGYITVATPPPTSQPLPRTSTSIHPADGLHSSNSSAEAGSSQSGSSFIHVPHPHLRRSRSKPSLDVARSNVTASTSAGGSTLRTGEKAAFLSAADLDGDEAEGEDAWAEGGSWWHGVGADQVDEVREGIRALETMLASGKLKSGDTQSALILLAYHHHAVAEHEAAIRLLDTVDWKVDTRPGGEAALLERIRGRCLQGISTELLHPSSTSALDYYLAVIPLMMSLFPSPTPSYLPAPAHGMSSKIPFEPNREVHRWVSTALCRAAVISSRRPDNLVQTLRILRTYHAYAASWPSSFRPNQRHRMLLLYLTALALAYPPSFTAALSPYVLTSAGGTNLTARAMWRKEAAVAIREGQQLLAQTTQFPRAGSVNVPVIRFTNLCVAMADRSAALTSTVIDVLWWSMTLTFQSQSVLRHLTRLLLRNGHDIDAKRTFELYVQLVLKAREAAQPEASLRLEQPSDAPGPSTTKALSTGTKPEDHQVLEQADEAEHEASQNPEAEIDGDAEFIGALLVGARVLSRELTDLEEGWRYASLAKQAIDKAAKGVGSKARAEVEEILGIIRMAMANTASDPITRPTHQAEAINHLLSATKLQPSSAQILYHLSYAQAEARAIDEAIESIRASLEIDAEDVQAWHLLALLLTAKRDWDGARKACEAGVAVWEGDEAKEMHEEEEEDGDGTAPQAAAASIESRDFAARSASQSRPSIRPAVPSAKTAPPLLLPSGAVVSLPPPDLPKSSRSRRLNNVIRLRMTLNVITEKTLGSEAAMLRQQELFAFFSARTGEGRKRFGYGGGALGGLGSFPSVGSIGGLGGSFVSVQGAEGADINVNVQAPTPAIVQGYTLDAPPHITHSSASSPGDSSPDGNHSENDDREEILSRDFAEKASIKDGKGKRSQGMGTGTKKSLVKHLHVPGVKSMGKGRPSSLRRLQSPSDVDLGTRNRTASMSSVALSIAPTAVHSHFHGAGPNAALRPPTAPPINTGDTSQGRTAAESRLLSNLWLMSAATFRRWGKPEQCLVAINEAELLDPENAEVWIQLGLYHSTTSGTAVSDPGSVDVKANTEMALSAFTKSILLRPLHPAGSTHLAKMYLSQGQVDLAHSFLNQVTQDSGWDMPEAWVLLARACKEQGRLVRERECLIYALGLEETRPARALRDAVDRWL